MLSDGVEVDALLGVHRMPTPIGLLLTLDLMATKSDELERVEVGCYFCERLASMRHCLLLSRL